MKKLLGIISLILLLACLFASCIGPITQEKLFDGKTPKDLYGSSINKYKNHKDQGVPYSINVACYKAGEEQANSVIDLTYAGGSLKYTITEGSSTEEIIFHGGVMYFKDKDGGKFLYESEHEKVDKYLTEQSRLKDFLPAFPENIPDSWFDNLDFVPSEDGEYFTVTAEPKKGNKNHPLYEEFYKSDVICKLYFTKEGILDKIELENVTINGEKNNLIISFSWSENIEVSDPGDKDDYGYMGDFDPDKGDKPGGDHRGRHQHTPGKTVIENEVKATCTAGGSYDEVVYCASKHCKGIYSKTIKITDPLGHDYVNGVCSRCKEQKPIITPDTGDGEYSEGLEFTSNGNGTCYVSGIGTCTDANVIIPTTSPTGDVVSSIGEYAFRQCNSLISIEIPCSVQKIAVKAFYWCENLENVTIGSGTSFIGDYAFHCCYNLKSIDVDENNIYYKDVDGNLYNKRGTVLIQYAIGKSEESFVIPDVVEKIGEASFWSAEALRNVTISNTVTEISDYAFCLCDNIERITIPSNVKVIGSRAFQHCTELRVVVLNEGLVTIGENAFNFCRYLKTIHIPSTVISIEKDAFGDCDRLESIEVNDNNEYYTDFDGNLYSKDMTVIKKYASGKTDEYFTIPDSVVSIEQGAFSECSNLLGVVIHAKIAVIDHYAFRYCKNISYFYSGTYDQWNAADYEWYIDYINDIAHKTEEEKQNILYFYLEIEPTSEGSFWHYINGVATPW